MLDALLTSVDRALKTLTLTAASERSLPDKNLPEADLDVEEKSHVVGLMRVNHSGEICAQALYQGQALTARDPVLRQVLQHAAREEEEHLSWTEHRLDELGGKKSVLNPLWYAGSFAIGVLAGLAGDRWSKGFLLETERQVEQHLSGHLARLPSQDHKSRAILEQMQRDEAKHALSAQQAGASELPLPLGLAMKLTATVMTRTAYRL